MKNSTIENLLKKNSNKTYNQARIIAENFSKKAHYYDQFATVQKFASHHLNSRITRHVNTQTPANILEIGCGTGLLSKYLASRFPKSKIDFIDPAAAMINLCEKNINEHLHHAATSTKHTFINTSIENYLKNRAFSKKQYSLIVSSFALHWLPDLASVTKNLIQRLEIDGQFFFSYPTNKSFPEWRSVCQTINLPFTGNNLPAPEEIHHCVQPNEAKINCYEYSYKLAFPNALEFFREMKNVGAGSNIYTKNKKNMLDTKKLSFKEFHQLLAAWNQMFSTNSTKPANNEKPEKYKQTIDCTYWLVEGIITRRS